MGLCSPGGAGGNFFQIAFQAGQAVELLQAQGGGRGRILGPRAEAIPAPQIALAADKAVDYPKATPLVTFVLPDTWVVDLDDEGLMATPTKDDDSVIVELSELEAGLDSLEAALKEAKETVSEFKNMKYDEIEKGQKDGLGIAILNHPSSFRYPTTWHVRTYGLFTANPFGTQSLDPKAESGALTLKKGEKITLRHRFIFHDGDEKDAHIAEAYADYAKK